MMGKPQFFGLWAGLGRAKYALDWCRVGKRVFMYLQVPNLGIEPVRAYNFFWILGFGQAQVGQNLLRMGGRAGQA